MTTPRRLLLFLSLALMLGCPTSGDDDDTTAGDDDDDSGDDDDDDSGDDDDDDDDSSLDGPIGACRFMLSATLVACAPSPEGGCVSDEGPKGTTTTWVEAECPAGYSASCAADEPGSVDWFYYLDQTHALHGDWCHQCGSDIDPANYCD